MRARPVQIVLLLIGVTPAACGISDPQQPSGSWNVTITGAFDYAALSGSAGVASQYGSTTAVLRVAGYPNATFTWRLHHGTCDAPGNGIGVEGRYPPLELGAQAEAEETAHINQMLDRNGEFALLVRSPAGTVAGCGALDPFRP